MQLGGGRLTARVKDAGCAAAHCRIGEPTLTGQDFSRETTLTRPHPISEVIGQIHAVFPASRSKETSTGSPAVQVDFSNEIARVARSSPTWSAGVVGADGISCCGVGLVCPEAAAEFKTKHSNKNPSLLIWSSVASRTGAHSKTLHSSSSGLPQRRHGGMASQVPNWDATSEP